MCLYIFPRKLLLNDEKTYTIHYRKDGHMHCTYARTNSFTSIPTVVVMHCATRIHVFVFNFMHKIVPFDS